MTNSYKSKYSNSKNKFAGGNKKKVKTKKIIKI